MRILIITFILLAFTTACFGQSDKDTKRLEEINSLISEKTINLAEAKANNLKLLKNFTEKHPKVIETETKIKVLTSELTELKKEKNEILERQFLNNLPNNQFELLKIIIRQNQQIIELLKKNNQ